MTPVLLWPWLWLQFWMLEKYLIRMEAPLALIQFNKRTYRIYVRFISDKRSAYHYCAPDVPVWERPAVCLDYGEVLVAFNLAIEPAAQEVYAVSATAPPGTARAPPIPVSPGSTRGLHQHETPDQVRRCG